MRLRKLFGTVALVLRLATWGLGALAFAQFPLIWANGYVEGLYFIVAGLGWVPQAMILVSWMGGRA